MANNPDEHVLDFQDFTSMNEPSGAIVNVPFDQTEIPLDDEPVLQPNTANNSNTPASNPQSPTNAAPTSAFWTIEYYQPYFNVDTTQVLNRLWRSFVPIKTDFLSVIRENSPDLWGPFWLVTTLICIIAITSNLAGLFNFNSFISQFTNPEATQGPHSSPKTALEWTSDFSVVTVGSTVLYSYAGVAPLLLWLMMRYKGVPVSIIETLCVYGYSFSVIIPFAVICIFDFNWLRWVSLLVAFSASALFIIMSLFKEWKAALSDPKDGIFVILFVAYVYLLHMGLALFAKLFFYTFATPINV